MPQMFGCNIAEWKSLFPYDKTLEEALQGIDDFYDKK